MTTLGLYQKWRPQVFADLVGQDPVVQTLRQAVTLGRVAHAYLFSGPRGTGKTSAARILAKALNCQSLAPTSPQPEGGLQGEPDGSCPFCLAVSEGRAMDLIEMDAASHRGIDDVRNLRDRVFGAGPAEGRCKVYIIDEAHMLTEPAFNALLKTLEEPAPWAYFILCTTEVHKIPATILSRCQRFDFRRIGPADVQARLHTVCTGEGIEAEPEALRTIARASWGSLRDACNVLEQAIVTAGSPITLACLQEILGLSRNASSLDLVRHSLAGDASQGLVVISQAIAAGADLRAFHRDVMEFLRAVLLSKAGVTEGLDYPAELLKDVQAIAAEASWDRLLLATKLFSQVNLRASEAPTTLPLELALVESTAAPVRPQPAAEQRASAAAPTRPAPAPSTPAPRPYVPPQAPRTAPADAPTPAPLVAAVPSTDGPPPERAPAPAPVPGAAAGASPVPPDLWDALRQLLKRTKGNKYVLGSLLLDCRQQNIEGDSLVLYFKNRANRDRLEEELQNPIGQRAVEEAVKSAFGREYTLRLTVEGGNGSEDQGEGGHLVRAAMALGARIVDP